MKHCGSAVIAVSILAACSAPDVPTAPLRPGATIARFIEPKEPPPEGPSTPVLTTILRKVEPDAGWAHGHAYGGAIVRYLATHAFAKATVETVLGSQAHEISKSAFTPLDTEIQPDVPTVPMEECQGTIKGIAYGRIWNVSYVKTTPTITGEQSKSSSTEYKCPEPRTPTTTQTTTPAGGSDGKTCYTLEIDYYWYYPATGQKEYRFTESFFWCENGEAYT